MRVAKTMAVLALCCMFTNASAQDKYPSKNIRMMVGFPAGGAVDTIARLYADEAKLGIVVENKPGAGGNLAADIVAKSPPDGYTLSLASTGSHGVNGVLFKNMPYDMVKDFQPVALLADTPNVFLVNKDSKFNTIQDLVTFAKSNPGKISYGSPGVGTSVHMSGELFANAAKIQLQHVPYKGRANTLPDLMGGHVDVVIDNLSSALSLIKEGKVKAIGVTSEKRTNLAPQLQTFAESGYPQVVAGSWFAIFAPKNTPEAIVNVLNQEAQRIFNSPKVQQRLAAMGYEPKVGTPKELAQFQAAEIKKWDAIVKSANIQAPN